MSDIPAMRALWLAVIQQALRDAMHQSPSRSLRDTNGSRSTLERDSADVWIKRTRADFREVCHLAGVDPDYLRKRYIERALSPGLTRNGRR